MISVRIPARYWLLGVTLLLPFINWFLVRHHVLDFPVEDHSIQDLWANYYEGIRLYRSALSIHAAVVLLLAVLVCVFSRWVERHWHLVLNAFILAGLVASAVFSMRMAFSIDEWEHIHASWKVHNGLLPFVDFFEHHHGLMWRLFAPGIAAVEDHSSVLLLSRVFIFGFWLLTLFIVYRTALLLTGHRTSSKYAVLLLLSFYMCVWPALEFRPDNPQVTFGMLSFYFFVRYRKHGRHVDILISGMGMGVSFLFLQKALYLCAALGCYQLYLAFTRRIAWSSVAVFTGACFIPVLPVAVGYLSRGHLGEYFFFNWALNLHKAATPGSWAYMVPDSLLNPFFPVLLAASFVLLWRERRKLPMDLVASAAIVVFLLLVAVVQPKAWMQYFLPAWPLAAILVGFFVNQCFGHHREHYQALGVLYVLGMSFGLIWVNAFVNSNRTDLSLVNYMQRNGITECFAVDPYLRNNAFAKDMHFFWFSLERDLAYPVYRELINREPYASWVARHHDDYDFCELVETRRPKYIYTYENPEVENLVYCRIDVIERYEQGPWEDLYQIKEKHAIPAE